LKRFIRPRQAGVKIDLIVRGICCLRPGVPAISENITVRSIVDRFLEHSRIWYFENACQPEVFLGSADWMPRNFLRRIEVVFPIEDGVLRERVKSELLDLPLSDSLKARLLQADGSYVGSAPAPGAKSYRSQHEYISLAAGERGNSYQSRKGNPAILVSSSSRDRRGKRSTRHVFGPAPRRR